MQEHGPQAELLEAIESVNNKSDIIKPFANICIYRNNTEETLVGMLRAAYPILSKLIGTDCFNHIAHQYALHYPSTSSNLNDYGEFFNVFIGEYQTTSHLTYLNDVARFEWFHHLLHDAPDHKPLDLSKLETISPDDYDHLKLSLLPACKLLKSDFPLIDIIELGLNESDRIIPLDAGGVYLMLYRPEFSIKTLILTSAEFAFFEAVADDQTLTTALEKANSVDHDFSLEEKLPLWVKCKLIVDCHLAHRMV